MRKELVDVSKMECPVCLNPFGDGAPVHVLMCGGSHIICGECNGKHCKTAEPKCPMCRGDCELAIEAVGVTYRHDGAGTQHDPVVINHMDEITHKARQAAVNARAPAWSIGPPALVRGLPMGPYAMSQPLYDDETESDDEE